jgi:hypothetical protein
MADLAYRNDLSRSISGPNWGAIWAGMFAFLAIWSVFGLLGEAIFASAATPNGNAVGNGIGWGMSIWAVILTGIAMYVAGRVTTHFSGAANRSDAMLAGQTMFGLSAAAVAILVLLTGAAITGGNGTSASEPYAVHTLTTVGWAGFAAFFLGWICAIGGATHNVRPVTVARNAENVRDIRAA